MIPDPQTMVLVLREGVRRRERFADKESTLRLHLITSVPKFSCSTKKPNTSSVGIVLESSIPLAVWRFMSNKSTSLIQTSAYIIVHLVEEVANYIP